MELCRQSHVWREVLDPIVAETGTHTYEFGQSAGTRVERVMVLKFNGSLLQQARPQDLLALDAATGTPRCFALMPGQQEFRVHPTPTAAQAGQSFEAFVALSPQADAVTIPDDLMREYAIGIIALAKAWLMLSSPGMPYHNLQEAAVQAGIGEDWIVRAKREQHGGGHAPLKMKIPRFA